MYVRSVSEIVDTERDVDWGNGKSYRLLLESDGMGYTVCHTVVKANTSSKLRYRNHLEACYCIAGEGEVEDLDGNRYPLSPGVLYVLNDHDEHYLRGGDNEDLVLVSVFNPPLKGPEKHDLSRPDSSY